jgi:hypothetical protein
VLTTDAVSIAMTQDVDVCVFGVLRLTPVAATGTHNPNGSQKEPERLTVPGLCKWEKWEPDREPLFSMKAPSATAEH